MKKCVMSSDPQRPSLGPPPGFEGMQQKVSEMKVGIVEKKKEDESRLADRAREEGRARGEEKEKQVSKLEVRNLEGQEEDRHHEEDEGTSWQKSKFFFCDCE